MCAHHAPTYIISTLYFLLQAAVDIMQKHGADLDGRPRVISADILSGGMRLLMMQPGNRLRRMKK